MTFVQPAKLPAHFYSLTHPARWQDKYANDQGEERKILGPHELLDRANRNEAYTNWLKRRGVKPRKCIFQAIQVLRKDHGADFENPWWDRFQDCLFRVFVNPHVVYDGMGHKQHYILCPEDSEMVQRERFKWHDRELPPRAILKGEKYLSKHPFLNQALIIPTECCRHWRHETTAGQLPVGL